MQIDQGPGRHSLSVSIKDGSNKPGLNLARVKAHGHKLFEKVNNSAIKTEPQ